MGLTAKFSYQRLRHEEGYEIGDERLSGRSRTWNRLKRVTIRRRFKLKVPSLRRFLRRKAKVVRISFAKLMKRLKQSQAHFADLFAGNYLFIQVNPTTMKSFEGPALKVLPSRYSLPRIA